MSHNFEWSTTQSPTAVSATLFSTPINPGDETQLPDGYILFQNSGSIAETIQIRVATADTSYSIGTAVYSISLAPSGGGSSSSSSSSSSTSATAVPTLPLFGVMLLGGLLGLFGLRKLKQ